jgi:hypothetical protein
VNGRLYNGLSWISVTILIVLTLSLLVMTVQQMFAC